MAPAASTGSARISYRARAFLSLAGSRGTQGRRISPRLEQISLMYRSLISLRLLANIRSCIVNCRPTGVTTRCEACGRRPRITSPFNTPLRLATCWPALSPKRRLEAFLERVPLRLRAPALLFEPGKPCAADAAAPHSSRSSARRRVASSPACSAVRSATRHRCACPSRAPSP